MNNLNWLYTETVRKHFFHPKGALKENEKIKADSADGIGLVGSPRCGDMMKIWIWVDKAKDRIKKVRWQTYGCASAIASTSMLAEMLMEKQGMEISKALKLSPVDILKRLGGLPQNKIHCSVLGDQALRKAIFDYFRKSHQAKRIPKAQ